MTGDGKIQLADFGIAIDTREELPIGRVGTLDYMVRRSAASSLQSNRRCEAEL